MTRILSRAVLLAFFLTLPSIFSTARAQGTAFTYQGLLDASNGPANGSYDVQFTLYPTSTGGASIAGPSTNSATAVTNGLFLATIDFGSNVWNGQTNWLDIAVRTNGSGTFTELTPRQIVTPTPYSIFAANAATAATVAATNITGTLLPGTLPAAVLTNNEGGVSLNGSYAGNGGGLTNLQLSGIGPAGTFSLLPIGFTGAINYPVAGQSASVAIADVNGDGKPDLITANSDGQLMVLTNNGSGAFALSTILAVGNEDVSVLAVTNVDGHGHTALITANSIDNTLTVLTNNASYVFGSNALLKVGQQPESITLVTNFDGLGHMALVSANASSNSLSIFTNNGAGVFGSNATVNVANFPWFVASADINGDGKPDLLCSTFNNLSVLVLTNNGHGIFSSNATIYVGAYIYGLALADVNGDGKPDLITADYGYHLLSLFLNNGSGGFYLNNYLPIGYSPIYVAATSINGDGKVDLVSANYGDGTVTVLTNNGSGVFGTFSTLNAGASDQWVSAADLNGNGKTDLVTANSYPGSVSVFLDNAQGLSTLSLSGGISSPMWKVNTVIDNSAGLPNSGNFTSSGGTLLIFASGSGYSTTGGTIGMTVEIDGVPVENVTGYANAANTHLAFVPKMIKTSAPAGYHTLTLVPLSGTSADFNDNFNVTVQELPF
ncbi:MAG TPA: VCBS repeat-containing protein [Verrucomicrobiae bacterium]|jgi:hypothetical protein